MGGPLAIVQNGDLIELDVANRRLNLLISEEEMQRRIAAWTPPVRHYDRGYGRLFIDHIQQANEGCDFDFLRHYEGQDVLTGNERSLARRAVDRLPKPF